MTTYTLDTQERFILCLLCGRKSWHPQDIAHRFCAACHVFHNEVLPMYTVYWNPSDFPNKFVLRCQAVYRTRVLPSDLCAVRTHIDEVRACVPGGLVRMDRHPNDDPCIVEIWL